MAENEENEQIQAPERPQRPLPSWCHDRAELVWPGDEQAEDERAEREAALYLARSRATNEEG